MRRFPFAALATFMALSCASDLAAAQASRDPHLEWRTIRTRHFEIHYHEPLGMVARRVAAIAERAHRVLSQALEARLSERVQVVISDDTDAANGSASALPYNTLRLYATAPEDLTPLGDYDDWLTELVTHEHTHILHLDTIGGIPALINTIFGKVLAPNHVQPRWFLEGLATHEESEHTSGGRLRSTMFDMFLRMDALEGRLLRIDQLSNSVDRWPHGNVWYLYGSRFVSFIQHRYGAPALAAISREYGRQLIPYGVNRVAKRATGKTFVELYDEWLEHLRADYGRVRARVEAEGLVEGRRLTRHGEQALSPRFVDDRRVVYFAADGENVGQLRTIDARTGRDARFVVRVAGDAYVAPHPNGRELYFHQIDETRDIYFFDDLFRHDARTSATERLTFGLRAREPDVSPDGRRIAFAANSASTSHLMIADTADVERTKRVLVRSRRYDQIYTPRFSPDGRTIVYSAWLEGGYRDLRAVDVATGEVRELTRDRAMDTGPCFSPDGQWLYFSSDRTGIANIYALELATGRTLQVTNVLGGAYHPAVSPDGRRLVYIGYTTYGFDLYGLDLDPATFREAPEAGTRPAGAETSALTIAASETYDPLPTLPPRGYLLDARSDPFGGAQIGVAFAGGDAVGYHAYAGRVGVSTSRGSIDAELNWTYQRLPTPVFLRAFRTVAPRGGLVVGGEARTWVEDAVGGEIGIAYGFPRRFDSEGINLAYTVAHLGKAEPFGGRLDPNDPPPQLPELGLFASLRAGWSYSNVERTTYDISPSGGHAVGVSLAVADPILGSRFRSVSLSWSATQYLETPWLEHHVLAVRYGGGLSGGDLGRRGLFSVGGFPDIPLIDSLLNGFLVGGAALRGYPPFDRSGTQYHLVQAEYRFPIYRPQIGLSTLPLYLDRLHGALFVDYGDAFFGELDLETFRVGVGGELLTEFTLGYFLPFMLRTGLAFGLSEGGGTQFYFNIGVPF